MKNAATIVVLLLTGIAECQQVFLSASTSLASKSPAAGLKREEGLDPVKDGELLSTEDEVDWATGRLEEKIGIGQDVERLGSNGDSIGGDGDDNDEEEPRFKDMNRALKKTSSKSPSFLSTIPSSSPTILDPSSPAPSTTPAIETSPTAPFDHPSAEIAPSSAPTISVPSIPSFEHSSKPASKNPTFDPTSSPSSPFLPSSSSSKSPSVPSSKNPSVPPLHATSTAQPIEPTPSNSYESSLSSSKPSVSYLPSTSSAPSSTLDTYLVMEAGTNYCADGYGTMTSAVKCESYADHSGLAYEGTENDSRYPKGCYIHVSTSVYFNYNEDGFSDDNSRPICEPLNSSKPSTSYNPSSIPSSSFAPSVTPSSKPSSSLTLSRMEPTSVPSKSSAPSLLPTENPISLPPVMTTAPVTTAPVTTAPVTTAPVTTAPVTTAPAMFNGSNITTFDEPSASARFGGLFYNIGSAISTVTIVLTM